MSNRKGYIPKPRHEGGFALIVGLAMLVLMTLLAVTAFQLGSNQTLVVANAQHRNEGVDAAQEAIETVVNSANFTINPAAAIPNGNCNGNAANQICVDINSDGNVDFTVTLTPKPTCITAAPIPVSQLDFTKANDLACATQTQQTFGVANASQSGNSLCANSTWEIDAQAADSATGTTVNIVQGVAVRIAATDMAANCP